MLTCSGVIPSSSDISCWWQSLVFSRFTGSRIEVPYALHLQLHFFVLALLFMPLFMPKDAMVLALWGEIQILDCLLEQEALCLIYWAIGLHFDDESVKRLWTLMERYLLPQLVNSSLESRSLDGWENSRNIYTAESYENNKCFTRRMPGTFPSILEDAIVKLNGYR